MRIKVTKRDIFIVENERLVQNNVKQYEIDYEFSDEWASYSAVAVFKNSSLPESKKVPIVNGKATIPAYSLSESGNLKFGVFGVKDDVCVIATLWTGWETVYKGTDTDSEEADDPHRTEWQQVIEQVGSLSQQAVEAKTAAENAVKSIFYYADKEKIKNHAYHLWYDQLNYNLAYAYFLNNAYDLSGACSSIRNGNFYGRNYDWKYDNQSYFVVNTKRAGKRYSSVGVSGGFPSLTEEVVSSGEYNSLYMLVPFIMLDGINEKGVVANVNVVPRDKGDNSTVLPEEDSQVTLPSTMIVRYILDNFDNATDAVSFIKNHVTVRQNSSLSEIGYEAHYMIADSEKTYLLEFIEGHSVVTEMDHPYMTNFFLSDISVNYDGTVYTPETQDETHNALDTNHITEHGSGLERYNLIAQSYISANDKTGMRNLLNQLKYTKTYSLDTDPFWYTEYVNGSITCASHISEFVDSVDEGIREFNIRSRDTGLTWQTCHSSIYDLSNKELTIIFQEDSEEEGPFTPEVNTFDETDPTVPSWAKQPNKPTYSAEEVGALPNTTVIPSKTSDLTNDSGYISAETDPTVPNWAKQPNKPTYSAEEVGAAPLEHNHDSSYYTILETNLLLANKQGTITDLDDIREGAEAGNTAYQKPSSGIPESDLSTEVKESLSKANSALQEHQSLVGYATQTWTQQQGYLTQHQDISGKQDKIDSENKLPIGNVSGYSTVDMVVEYDDSTPTATYQVVVVP